MPNRDDLRATDARPTLHVVDSVYGPFVLARVDSTGITTWAGESAREYTENRAQSPASQYWAHPPASAMFLVNG